MSERRVALVTGASSGIGLHTALGLARAGMRVIMPGRHPARTETARQLVTAQTGSDSVDILLADFSRLAEVRRLADQVLSAVDHLDVLVNNAGLFSPRRRLSSDGFELTLASTIWRRSCSPISCSTVSGPRRPRASSPSLRKRIAASASTSTI